MKTYKQFLGDAYYSVSEGWVPPNLPKLVSRLGSLEKGITGRRDSPEYARYRRVADVASQTRNNPNIPFKRPDGDDYLNSVWNKFSSKIKPQSSNNPVQKPSSTRVTSPSSPSNNNRFRGSTGAAVFRDRMGDYSNALRSRGAGAAGGFINITTIDTSLPDIQGIAKRRAERQFTSRGGFKGV
jgi:hypothetical protein